MLGLTKQQRKFINKLLGSMFDTLAFNVIGDIPQLKNKKSIIMTAEKPVYTLARVFVNSMGNKPMNQVEQRVMNRNLETALEYVEKLKSKTQIDTVSRLDGFIKTQQVKGKPVTKEAVQEILDDELRKAGNHIKAITQAEATKARNVGKGLDIVKVAGSQNVADPIVFFVVIKDNVTCKECARLHLMPDKVTPRLWYFSELNHDYHKKGNSSPSINGLHPHCRCTLTYLAPGFGFDGTGKVKFIKTGHDALKKQRGLT